MIDKAITNPGFHKQFQLDRFNEQEKKILKSLARGWYLTNSGAELRIAQSRYNYFLMKPTHNTSEMFNIEREIICVFSDYDYFEPRALDFFELVKTRLPRMRTETVCAVLIGKARDTESKVEHLLKSDPEHQIIVPVSYNEMLQKNALITLKINSGNISIPEIYSHSYHLLRKTLISLVVQIL